MKAFEKNAEYGNPVLNKSFHFSVRIVKFYQLHIKNDYSVKDILKQVLRSGTSIGANVVESQDAASKKDFINKLTISLKEARETEYWLKLLKESNIIIEKEFSSLHDDCRELLRLLTSIIKSAKQ